MLFYVTALVEGDAIHFADDIYRHDARLELALAERAGL
jgi:murein L,D-transpeptidase YcbB/YkuD